VPRFVCQSPACRREIALEHGNGTGQNFKAAMQLWLGDEESLYEAFLPGTLRCRRSITPRRADRNRYVSWELFHEKNIDSL